jgi:hypothetical protein
LQEKPALQKLAFQLPDPKSRQNAATPQFVFDKLAPKSDNNAVSSLLPQGCRGLRR